MSAGFDSLTDFKAFLLPGVIREDTDFDTEITLLGKGVAKAFDSYCNRRFLREVDASEIVSADRWHYIVRGYPIESVSLVELKSSEASGWVAQADAIDFIREDNGVIDFGSPLGPSPSLLRITYTGGYWVDTSEDNSGTLPSGATALPADLHLAWLQQCKDLWTRRDKLGDSFNTENQQAVASLLQAELLPMVKHTLTAYRRYMIS